MQMQQEVNLSKQPSDGANPRNCSFYHELKRALLNNVSARIKISGNRLTLCLKLAFYDGVESL